MRLVRYEKTVTGPCSHCGEPCTEEDYCFGCRALVCGRCSPYPDEPGGSEHSPADHLLFFPRVGDGARTCRWVVRRDTPQPVLCGKPAALSAYCREHLHAAVDERLDARRPS